MIEATISLAKPDSILPLFGTRDQHIRKIRESLNVVVTHREGTIRVAGEEAAVAQATDALEELKRLVERRGRLDEDEVNHVLRRVTGDELSFAPAAITVAATGREIRPRTPGQQRYVKAIRNHDLVFAIGPAGTGKTYLAVAMAVEALKNQVIRKIVLVRPAVEAGESLGYLPGDIHAKINPYLRPLLDGLREMMDYEQMKRKMEEDVIEVVPLAYMRGRTLNDAFIILDEAQNTTISQMKMFLTRMGANSKIVCAGDTTQTDLDSKTRSGLMDACQRLRDIKGFKEVRLEARDIVRHALVQKIVAAYEDTQPSTNRSPKQRGVRR